MNEELTAAYFLGFEKGKDTLREILSLYFELLDMNYEMTTRHMFAPSHYSKESVVNAVFEHEETLECVEAALRKEVKNEPHTRTVEMEA